MNPVAIEILKPVFNIILAAIFGLSLVKIAVCIEGLENGGGIDKGLNLPSGVGGDIDAKGCDNGCSHYYGSKVGNDQVGISF